MIRLIPVIVVIVRMQMDGLYVQLLFSCFQAENHLLNKVTKRTRDVLYGLLCVLLVHCCLDSIALRIGVIVDTMAGSHNPVSIDDRASTVEVAGSDET